MLEINRLSEYLAECKELIVSKTEKDEKDNPKKLFNYTDIILDNKELGMILKDRIQEENTYLIAVLPEFQLKGEEDSAEWENILAFFILDKTDYSEHDRDSYLNLFAVTQKKALAFVKKLLDDKSNHSGLFCNFLAKLREDSITVKPVWKNNECNGWMIEINFDSPL